METLHGNLKLRGDQRILFRRSFLMVQKKKMTKKDMFPAVCADLELLPHRVQYRDWFRQTCPYKQKTLGFFSNPYNLEQYIELLQEQKISPEIIECYRVLLQEADRCAKGSVSQTGNLPKSVISNIVKKLAEKKSQTQVPEFKSKQPIRVLLTCALPSELFLMLQIIQNKLKSALIQSTIKVWSADYNRLNHLYPRIFRTEFKSGEQVVGFLRTLKGKMALKKTIENMNLQDLISTSDLPVLKLYFEYFGIPWNAIQLVLVDPFYPCEFVQCPKNVYTAALGDSSMESLILNNKWTHSFDFVVGVNCPAFTEKCSSNSFLTPQAMDQIEQLLMEENGFGFLALLSSSRQAPEGHAPYDQTIHTYICLPDREKGVQIVKAVEMKTNGLKHFSVVNKGLKYRKQ